MEQALAYAAETYGRGKLVDIGCGSKPWRTAFAPYVTEHVGVDLVDSKRAPGTVDVIAGAYEIPLEDGCADTVLMSVVLSTSSSRHGRWPRRTACARPAAT